MSTPTELRTFQTVLRVFGGAQGMATALNFSLTQVCNWQDRGEKFPARHFLLIQNALEARGYTASRSLFNFISKRRLKQKSAA